MSTLRTVPDAITDVLVQQLGLHEAEVTIDAKLSELGADSLELVAILVKLEDRYQRPLSRAEEVRCYDGTVGDLVTLFAG